MLRKTKIFLILICFIFSPLMLFAESKFGVGIGTKLHMAFGWTKFLTGTSVLGDYFAQTEKESSTNTLTFLDLPLLSDSILRRSDDGFMVTGGGGLNLAIGYKEGRVVSFDVLFGRSPYDDLLLKLAAEWHMLPIRIPNIDPVVQIYIGLGTNSTLLLDTKNDDINHFGYLGAFSFPVGVKYYFLKNFDLFLEVLPQIGLLFQGFSSSVRSEKHPIGVHGLDFHGTYGFGINLGLRYWLQ